MKTKKRQNLCAMACSMILDSLARFSNPETSLLEKTFLLKNTLAWFSIIETRPKIQRLACIKYIRDSYIKNALCNLQPMISQTNDITPLLSQITKRIECIQSLRSKP